MATLIALVITSMVIMLVKMQVFPLVCKVGYLNPWQYFFRCDFLPGLGYLALFMGIVLLAHQVLKKVHYPRE